MTPDFDLAHSDFNRQLDILEILLATIDISSNQSGPQGLMIGGLELPIPSAGGKNTMVAALIVLLAAHFEEYVREQVSEYANAILPEYDHLKDDLRSKIIENYWKSGAFKLGKIRPKSDLNWNASAGPILNALLAYPVGNDRSTFMANLLCEHDHNMRWETVCELTKRVGVKSLADLMSRNPAYKSLLGNPKKGDFATQCSIKLNDFIELRNGIVHSISQNSMIGATIFKGWVEFFRKFSAAFSAALSDSHSSFEAEILKAKAKTNLN